MGKAKITIIKDIYNDILDIIYPLEEKCITCGESGFIGICPLCKSNIKRSIIYDKEVISYGFYGGKLKELILEFKCKSNFTAGRVLSEMILEIIESENIYADLICYVPMTRKAKKKRGFSQCKFIAKYISNKTDINLSECIKKYIETREQKRLSKDERIENVKDAFKITENIYGKNIILIDDVITTGATITECKKVLKKSGANKIIVLTIAKSNI